MFYYTTKCKIQQLISIVNEGQESKEVSWGSPKLGFETQIDTSEKVCAEEDIPTMSKSKEV